MKKRILATLLVVISILSLVSTAFAVDTGISCSEITFVDESGEIITSVDGSEVTAKVDITSNTSGKKPVLLVCSFASEMLNGVWYKTAENTEGEIEVTFTPVSGSTLKASVIDGFKTLNNPYATAEALKESNEISKIYINGKLFTDYSNDVDVYEVKVDKNSAVDIDVIPEDGGTKVDITYGEGIPQICNIKTTSLSNVEKNVDFIFYSDSEQLSAPLNLCYELDGTKYEVEGFDPGVYEYDVVLPDDTFYVNFALEALPVSNVKLMVQDINTTDMLFDGVSYIKASLATEALQTYDERPMRDNLVPIKNEHTKAIAYVEYDGITKKYTVNFKARQPRLTEFTIADAVVEADTYLPAFVSGAAVNNDNGSIAGTDRAWALSNVSENLLGASMFTICNGSDDRNKAENNWNDTNSSGEYFSFRADRSGTLYFVTAKVVKNTAEWDLQTGSHTNDGKWRKVGGQSYTYKNDTPRDMIISGHEYNVGYVTWYSKSNGAPYVYKYADDAITKTLEKETIADMSRFVYARTFEEGELVTVYHAGCEDITTDITGRRIFLIKWDLNE